MLPSRPEALQGLRAGASVSERRCSKGLEEIDDADMLADSSESFIVFANCEPFA